MTFLSALSLSALIVLLGYIFWPVASHWWNTKRPVKCPKCHHWFPIEETCFIRHNSGVRVRVCLVCRKRLYSPFSGDDK